MMSSGPSIEAPVTPRYASPAGAAAPATAGGRHRPRAGSRPFDFPLSRRTAGRRPVKPRSRWACSQRYSVAAEIRRSPSEGQRTGLLSSSRTISVRGATPHERRRTSAPFRLTCRRRPTRSCSNGKQDTHCLRRSSQLPRKQRAQDRSVLRARGSRHRAMMAHDRLVDAAPTPTASGGSRSRTHSSWGKESLSSGVIGPTTSAQSWSSPRSEHRLRLPEPESWQAQAEPEVHVPRRDRTASTRVARCSYRWPGETSSPPGMQGRHGNQPTGGERWFKAACRPRRITGRLPDGLHDSDRRQGRAPWSNEGSCHGTSPWQEELVSSNDGRVGGHLERRGRGRPPRLEPQRGRLHRARASPQPRAACGGRPRSRRDARVLSEKGAVEGSRAGRRVRRRTPTCRSTAHTVPRASASTFSPDRRGSSRRPPRCASPPPWSLPSSPE